MRSNPGATGPTRVLAAMLVSGFLLTGCSGADRSDSSAGAGEAKKDPGGPNNSAPQTAEKSGSSLTGVDEDERRAAGRNTSARVLPPPRDIVYRGQVSVRVKDVVTAAHRAEQIVGAADGHVFAEETTTEGGPRTSSAHLTLRVPPPEFRPVMRDLARLGRPSRQSQTAEDVTTQVVDISSRIATQRRSVTRVRTLLDQAKTIGQVVQVESELARREADLESLEAQLARLKDVTELATIELDLVAADAPAPKPDDTDLGFLAGLRGGWDAFVQIVLVALTVLGALLPFAIAAMLLGVPLWLLLRARLRRRGPVAPQAPTA